MDFERLGVFYLGRRIDDAGSVTSEPILYPSKDLVTHALCVGMTGSGKTGLCVSLLEEAALDAVPAIVIDPKGDLSNVALAFPELAPEDFADWIDPGEAQRAGRTVQEHAAEVARDWREGLAAWGQDGARVARFRDAARVTLYTPGSSGGRPLSVLGSLRAPAPALAADPDAVRERVQTAATGLLSLLGVDADPLQSREHILVSTLIANAWADGRDVDLGELVRSVGDPGIERVGVMDLETFFPAKDRGALAIKLNNLLASPAFGPWVQGEPLDVGRLLYGEDGAPRLSVLSIAHLDDTQRMFFVTLLLNEVVAWMRTQPGTTSLRAILYMDEVFGFFPPVKNPPAKTPMLTLLKQARAHGLGVVLATQNPVDLDYKGLSNCGTWLLGRLSTERDVDRVLDGLRSAATDVDAAEIRRTLGGLDSRQFVMNDVHDDGPVRFRTRWAMSYLRGPLTRAELLRLIDRDRADVSDDAEPTTGEETPASPEPPGTPGIDQVVLAPTAGQVPARYRPAVLAHVEAHYTHRYSGLDAWAQAWLLGPPEPDGSWKDAEVVNRPPSTDAPATNVGFVALPKGVDGKGLARSGKALRSHARSALTRTIFYCEEHRLWSADGEDRAAFTARVRQIERERRDAEVEKLRERFAGRTAKLQARVDKAADKLRGERAQLQSQKTQTSISVGSTLLGAVFGGRAVGRATTAARGAARIRKEQQDVVRAEQSLTELQAELAELEAELKSEVETMVAAELELPPIEERLVPPREDDLRVRSLVLAWVPEAG